MRVEIMQLTSRARCWHKKIYWSVLSFWAQGTGASVAEKKVISFTMFSIGICSIYQEKGTGLNTWAHFTRRLRGYLMLWGTLSWQGLGSLVLFWGKGSVLRGMAHFQKDNVLIPEAWSLAINENNVCHTACYDQGCIKVPWAPGLQPFQGPP